MRSFRPLRDGWSLRPVQGCEVPTEVAAAAPVPATVPGCVHTDLLAAGLIPDPHLDDHETRLHWIGRADWCYDLRFNWRPEPGEQVDLVCAGLDTLATISLNGQAIGVTANMHRSYEFAVGDALRDGGNHLQVRFDSAYRYAERLREELGDRPAASPRPYAFIRKMACNFGWDWGPEVVTAGIWREIGLRRWRVARLAEVVPLVTVDGAEGRVDLRITVARAPAEEAEPLTLTAEVTGHGTTVRGHVVLAPGRVDSAITLAVPRPARWWPRGYGEQARYQLRVSLTGPDGATLDSWQRLVGFRSVRLDTAPDRHGTAYTLVVNDTPIVVRGVNWIPDDTFVSRVDRERYATRLAQAAAANVNYLRVWGGGIYESFDFYDLCDELGLLVGQDFLFSCAAYPEEQPIADEVAAEARDNVLRLISHPSLVTWTGNNENVWGWHDWGWQPRLSGRTWGAGYYFDLLPRIVSELDPTRPYWPASPYSGDRSRHPNDPAHGSLHIWDVWNQRDYLHYRSYTARFVAEFGWQAPAAYATLRRSISDRPLAPDSPGMRHHQKAQEGDLKLRRGLERHLPPPRDFDHWHYLTQLNQARAVSVAIEHFRALRPVCMGVVVWQLNDCWPAISWSAIDGDGRLKPVWYALRRVFADRLLTIQPRPEGLTLVAVNDSATPWRSPVTVARFGFDGQLLADGTIAVEVAARSAVTVPLPSQVVQAGQPQHEVVVASAGGLERAWWFFDVDRELAYPPARYDAAVEQVPGGARVTVTARTLLRDIVLYPDRLDPAATVDRALVTLLPGESVTFVVSGLSSPVDPEALTRPPVLRCVND